MDADHQEDGICIQPILLDTRRNTSRNSEEREMAAKSQIRGSSSEEEKREQEFPPF